MEAEEDKKTEEVAEMVGAVETSETIEAVETTGTVETAEGEEAPVEQGPVAPLPPPPPSPPKPKGPHIPLPSSLQEIVGALLFASETPLTAGDLRAAVKGVEPTEDDDAEIMSVYQSCTSREIEQALRGLEKELERSGCGFRLVCAGGSYRLQTAPACGRYVRALLKLDRPNRLSRASLETLAIIAYRQPITKAEIEQIRGVAVDTIVKTLVDLQLVRLVGRSELPGHPFLYGTTPLFLEHFGLASLSELNAIDPTLQRSNPRERAKLFVKKEKQQDKQPTPEEAAKEAAAAETAVAAPEGAETPMEDEAAPAEGEEFVEAVEMDEPIRGAGLMAATDEEDDVFIDDTPDEFDDDDDDEGEEDEFDEEDEEDDGDEEGEGDEDDDA